MRNWEQIIKYAEDQKLITKQETDDLREKYELLKEGGVGKAAIKVTKGIGKVINKDTLPYLVAASFAIPIATEVASMAVAPINRELRYKAMKKHLGKIQPDIVKSKDDKHIRQVYHMVRVLAPIVTANPAMAAVAVREAIDLPQNLNVQTMSSLAKIQRDITGRGPQVSQIGSIGSQIRSAALKEMVASSNIVGSGP